MSLDPLEIDSFFSRVIEEQFIEDEEEEFQRVTKLYGKSLLSLAKKARPMKLKEFLDKNTKIPLFKIKQFMKKLKEKEKENDQTESENFKENNATSKEIEKEEDEGINAKVKDYVNLNAIVEEKTLHTLLHKAVRSKSLPMTIFFVEQKLDINAQDVKGETPLHKCIIRKLVLIAKYLLENGADPYIEDNRGVDCFKLLERLLLKDKIKPEKETILTIFKNFTEESKKEKIEGKN